MTDNHDQNWFETLAGRATVSDDPIATNEALQLRKRMLARAAEPAADVPAQDRVREEQLIARARREGLLPSRIIGQSSRFPWRATLAAAAVVCVAIVAGYQLRNVPPPEVVRSGPSEVVRLSAANPLAFKQQILDDLRGAGVTATGYEQLGRQGIDADLPQPLSSEVRAVLQKYRIAVPADGVLRVEIDAEGTP